MKFKEESHEYWRQKITDLRRSGLSRREFCHRHHLKLSSLSYWITKLGLSSRTSLGPSSFAKVSIDPSLEGDKTPSSPPSLPIKLPAMCLRFPSGMTLSIEGAFDPSAVAALIHAMGGFP